MHDLLNVCGVATAAIGLVAFAPGAIAQDNTYTLNCQDVGPIALEPLGDREGHSVEVAHYSCRQDSGPMAGGVSTGTIILDWDKTGATVVSGNGIIRKPGSTLVYQESGGKLLLLMADGKITGWTSEGRGSFPMAIGDAALLSGKSYSYTGKATGPGQFQINGKVE
jgi:hypothetical protein